MTESLTPQERKGKSELLSVTSALFVAATGVEVVHRANERATAGASGVAGLDGLHCRASIRGLHFAVGVRWLSACWIALHYLISRLQGTFR